jgi:hypothetical protein
MRMKPNALSVQPHRGAPCLHVDGVPHSGLAFWHGSSEKGIEEWQLFARCRVHLLQVNMGLWPAAADGADPAAAWDTVLATALRGNPEARFWIRLGVEPPAWWLAAHPDEAQVHHDEHNDERFLWRVAYTGPCWRAETAARLERFVAHMEAHWGERVWCYHPCAGDCGEWAYSWKPVLSGYAPAQTAAWREWLRTRYPDDAALRMAWGDPGARVATAEPPPRPARLRPRAWPPASHLIDPATERAQVDWLHFHGYVQADALAVLAAALRRALAHVGRQKLIGAFHGYHIWPYGSAYGACNTGFSDLDPVLRSPDIDVLCTPLAYIHRNPGGVYSHHNLAASIRLHGKLFCAEDDTFTHRAAWTPWRYCCRDAPETVQILRRNLAGALADGGGQWWMDHDSARWYCDAELEAGVAGMRRLADNALARDRSPCAEVVFVTHEASFRLLRQDPALIDLLWPKQQTELMRLGAPVDFVRVRDLALAERSGDLARWKLAVVAGCLWLDAAERDLLRRTLLRDGRHVLSLHGQGICDGARLDLEFTGALTGVQLKSYPHGGPCRAETVLDGAHLSWGTDKEVAPILYADDPAAEVLGWLERQYCPVLVRRRHADWTALWSGVPGLPWNLLGRLADDAGVHRYVRDGSQVLANAGLLAVHAAGDGARTLVLPRPRHLTDALSGADLGMVVSLPLDLRRGDTRIWHQEDA